MSAAPPTKIIINQTDNIGDLVLTSPLASVIKASFPNCKIVMLARRYTKPVVECCEAVDEYLDWEALDDLTDNEIVAVFKAQNASAILHIAKNRRIAKLAKKAGIPIRVGSNQRLYHWKYCSKLVPLARRNSWLHEAQLNLKLLKPFGIYRSMSLKELIPHLRFKQNLPLPEHIQKLLDPNKFNLIIHPGSHGHGREWPEDHFVALINQLPSDQFNIFITGAPKEEERFKKSILDRCPHAQNLMGKMSLEELIGFIQQSNGLIASGTGPLHLAAALGIKTLGLFPPRKGINPRRWSPLGTQGEFLVHKRAFLQSCLGCRDSIGCACMAKISVAQVLAVIERWSKTEPVSAVA